MSRESYLRRCTQLGAVYCLLAATTACRSTGIFRPNGGPSLAGAMPQPQATTLQTSFAANSRVDARASEPNHAATAATEIGSAFPAIPPTAMAVSGELLAPGESRGATAFAVPPALAPEREQPSQPSRPSQWALERTAVMLAAAESPVGETVADATAVANAVRPRASAATNTLGSRQAEPPQFPVDSSTQVAQPTMLQAPVHAASSPAAEVNSRIIRVSIQNVRPGRGMVKVAIFSGETEFPDPQAAFASKSLASDTERITVEFPLPAAGSVAVAAFQDVDGNGAVTRARTGIPVEPVAFSNNPSLRRGPPSFADAAVRIATTANSPPPVIGLIFP